jgi:hypothetical protein
LPGTGTTTLREAEAIVSEPEMNKKTAPWRRPVAADLPNDNPWVDLIRADWVEGLHATDPTEIDLDLISAFAEGRLDRSREPDVISLLAESPEALECFVAMRSQLERTGHSQTDASAPLPLLAQAADLGRSTPLPLDPPHRGLGGRTVGKIAVRSMLLTLGLAASILLIARMTWWPTAPKDDSSLALESCGVDQKQFLESAFEPWQSALLYPLSGPIDSLDGCPQQTKTWFDRSTPASSLGGGNFSHRADDPPAFGDCVAIDKPPLTLPEPAPSPRQAPSWSEIRSNRSSTKALTDDPLDGSAQHTLKRSHAAGFA